ncbi:MAG: hypothetical protein RIB65_16720 [Ilumatobacter fluminis]|uniref:hypothetical protein n=1 Tax=Ilumatobacter fluminis TaxID=467091 RepID=UPI0032EBBE58
MQHATTARGRRRVAVAALVAIAAACSTPAEDADDTDDADISTDDSAATSAPADDEGESSPDPTDGTTAGTTAGTTTDTTADTATSGDGTGDTPATSAPADDEPAGPATLDPVTVAVMYPDLSVAAQFGFAEEIGDFTPVFEAFAADANERGGIAGHPIELEMVEFDLLVDGDAVSACLTATQDLDAFVVIGLGGVYGDPVVCVAEQNETLLLQDDGSPAEFYERADGRLFSLTPNKAESQVAIVDAFADELAAAPFAVFATLDTGGDYDTMQEYLLPALDGAGLEPAVVVVIDSDTDVAASQIPIEVEEIRAAGVENVIATPGFFSTAAFAQALDAGGVDVRWIGSDAGGFASDLYASQMPPAQMDGALAITTRTVGWRAAGLDEPASRLDCRERAAELVPDGDFSTESIDVAAAVPACNFVDLLVLAGQGVDGDLTTESLATAIHGLAELELVERGPSGFGIDKFTAADEARTIEWSADCECWTAISDFEPLFAE